MNRENIKKAIIVISFLLMNFRFYKFVGWQSFNNSPTFISGLSDSFWYMMVYVGSVLLLIDDWKLKIKYTVFFILNLGIFFLFLYEFPIFQYLGLTLTITSIIALFRFQKT